MAAKAKDIDWDSIEPGWRQGVKSFGQLAIEYNGQKVGTDEVTGPMINSHFKHKKIPRDLTAKINAKTKSIVSKSIVSTNVSNVTDNEIIEASAKHASEILIGHRLTISRGRELSNALLRELEQQTLSIDEYEKLGELMRSESDSGRDALNDVYKKIIATPGRVDALKKLSDTVKTFIGLERQALNISDNANGDADKPPVTPTPTGDFLTATLERLNAASTSQ